MADPIPNRKHKDSVFIDLFQTDETARQNFISLYNALHDMPLPPNATINPIRLEQVMYMAFSNDVSCLVEDKIIVLAEHQSTINENMPLRFLEYVTRLYEQIMDKESRYHRKLVEIPYPEFYVFYNGEEEYPVSKTLRLSEAFKVKDAPVNLELKVEVININTEKHSQILGKCRPLEEYSQFVEIVRRHVAADKDTGFKKAIEECVKNGILKEYLGRKTREVMNMLIAEYDYATDIAVQKQEAWDEAWKQASEETWDKAWKQASEETWDKAWDKASKELPEKTLKQTALNMLKDKVSIDAISKYTGLPFEIIRTLKEKH